MADLSTYEGRQAARDAGNGVGTDSSGNVVSEPGHPGGQAGPAGGGGAAAPATAGNADLSGYVAAMQASSGFSIKQLEEQKREYDQTLEWQKQQWRQQGLPELAIKQRAQDLEDAKFGELQRSALVSEGLQTRSQDLQEKVQLGQLSIAQAQQQLQDYVQRGQLAVSQGQLGVSQGQLGLDTLKTAASLSGPQNWIQASNFARGVQGNPQLPGFVNQLLSGQSTATLGGPQPGAQMSPALSMGGMAAGMGVPGQQQPQPQPGQMQPQSAADQNQYMQMQMAQQQAQGQYAQQQPGQLGQPVQTMQTGQYQPQGAQPPPWQQVNYSPQQGGPALSAQQQAAQQQYAQMQTGQYVPQQGQPQTQQFQVMPGAAGLRGQPGTTSQAAGATPSQMPSQMQLDQYTPQNQYLQGYQNVPQTQQYVQQQQQAQQQQPAAPNQNMYGAPSWAQSQYPGQPSSAATSGQGGGQNWSGATTADVAKLFGRTDPYAQYKQQGWGQDTSSAQQGLQQVYARGGQALGPQQLEGMTSTEKQMFEGGGAAIGADVQGFNEQYARSRIGQSSARPSTFSGM